jgi:hypothetical protein
MMTNYQKIRAAIEAPLLTAFNNQTPPVPVYFDNVTAVPPDPPKEYVRINVTFGLMDEAALASNLDRPRGAIVIRCFAPKGGGPARCQELVAIAAGVLRSLSATTKTPSSVFVRVGSITGPSFYGETVESIEASMTNQIPHFAAKISAGWQAVLPCSS